MSYRQRIDNDDNESALLTNRVGLHSNPFLNSSIILSPPNTGLIPSFGLAGNFPNNVIGTAMGTTDDEFCMNGIAKNYIKEINLEVTTRDRYNTVIRTDGVLPVPVPAYVETPLYADNFIEYADLLTYNDISFTRISRITNGYQRLIRAGNMIDINSNNDNNFEFDAQVGSTVDIRIVDFANSPSDCEPNFWNPKNNNSSSNSINNVESSFAIYPNPTRSNPKMEYNIFENNTVINLWIIDALGRTIKIIHEDKLFLKGNYKEILNISTLENGFYRVMMTMNGDKLSQELIIIK
jgi:hypothetical protein